MVARLRAGAPLIPWRLPRIRDVFNGLEYFIHHEDVRRANGREPRAPTADLEALSWRMIGFSARRLARRIRPYGLELVRPDGAAAAVRIRGDGDAHRSGNRARPLPQRQTRDGARDPRRAMPMPLPPSSDTKMTV